MALIGLAGQACAWPDAGRNSAGAISTALLMHKNPRRVFMLIPVEQVCREHHIIVVVRNEIPAGLFGTARNSG